jgi:hypothetical protein
MWTPNNNQKACSQESGRQASMLSMWEESRLMPRLTKNSTLICHMDLGWGNYDPCREQVKNNALSIMEHMIRNHGWSRIPELEKPLLKTVSEQDYKRQYYVDNPKEWFIDNQLFWPQFKQIHFRKPEPIEERN